jgi:hypothetical protein
MWHVCFAELWGGTLRGRKERRGHEKHEQTKGCDAHPCHMNDIQDNHLNRDQTSIDLLAAE